MYQLSILLPSAYPDKLERFIQNLKDTCNRFEDIEVVICLDGNSPAHRDGNIVTCYSPPTKFRSTFHWKPLQYATGRWLMMANDDIEFKTKGWDQLIPYFLYPDDLGMFHFKDGYFNERFACHPVFSRKVIDIDPNIVKPLYQITKCDNTVWDIYPPNRRMYLPEIEIVHHHEGYTGEKWMKVYEEDNVEYLKHSGARAKVRNKIVEMTGEKLPRIMLGVSTAEFARRADFYDHYQLIEKPQDSICITVHGQSIANNRNRIAEQAVAHGCSHLLFLDDDVIPRPDIIYQLLKHDKDIVMALQLRRNFPHYPLVYEKELRPGEFSVLHIGDESRGLARVFGGGLGAVLISTDVFKALEKPWFRFGEYDKDQMSEDTGFYKRANQAGFEVYCDIDCPVGHIASAIVRPVRVNGMWTINYDTGSDGSIGFPFSGIKKRAEVKA